MVSTEELTAAPAGEPTTTRSPADPAARRLSSLDAARGLAIVIMLLSMNPGHTEDRPAQLAHPTWEGLTFADLFFPLFLFTMGISTTLSSRSGDMRQVLRRVAILAGLGIGLVSLRHEHLGWPGVLQHIAGSYLLAALVLRLPRRWHLPVALGIGATMWISFLVWAGGGDPWGRDSLAHAVDESLFGSFSTEGALQTVMSTVTVLGGAMAGYLVHRIPDRRALLDALLVRGGALVAAGLALAPLVPINKRLWTPSFAVLTVGTSYLWFALALWLVDIRGLRRRFAPLIHVGTNPIAIYVLFMVALALVRNHWQHLVPRLRPFDSPTLGFMAYALGWTVLWWLFAKLLYRRRLFLKV